uniref:De novo design apixaban-binding protein: apx1049 n=2 Tax=synthetic construct TaxID=32630 RepID=UPI00398D691D
SGGSSARIAKAKKLIYKLEKLWNARDNDGILKLFKDDAVFNLNGVPYKGKEAIKKVLESAPKAKYKITKIDIKIVGNEIIVNVDVLATGPSGFTLKVKSTITFDEDMKITSYEVNLEGS